MLELSFKLRFADAPEFDYFDDTVFTAKFLVGTLAWDDSVSNYTDV